MSVAFVVATTLLAPIVQELRTEHLCSMNVAFVVATTLLARVVTG